MSSIKTFTFLHDTPLGKIQAAASKDALLGLWFLGQRYFPKDIKAWAHEPEHPLFKTLAVWLDDYFDGRKPRIKIPLAPSGSDFRQVVWKILMDIPYGETTTYGTIASLLGAPGKKLSAQAVGGAVGHNPLSIIIPCHRVIGSDGSLKGYAGGVDKKEALLKLERGA